MFGILGVHSFLAAVILCWDAFRTHWSTAHRRDVGLGVCWSSPMPHTSNMWSLAWQVIPIESLQRAGTDGAASWPITGDVWYSQRLVDIHDDVPKWSAPHSRPSCPCMAYARFASA